MEVMNMNLLGLRVVVLLVAHFVCASFAFAGSLYVGAASVSITPDRPVALDGQMMTRVSKDVLTPVTANALALETRDGETVLEQAVFVSCDLPYIIESVSVAARERVKQIVPEFDVSKLIISATHTHTAPVQETGIYEIPSSAMQPVEYVEFLVERIADVVAKAWTVRKPASAGWGLGHAVLAINRRSVYADGTAQMYGPTDAANFRGFEGGEDHGVEVLCFWDADGKLVATAVNVACPAQEVEGLWQIDADLWHPVREALRAKHGNDLVVIAWTGAAGDQSPHLMYNKRAEERMRELRKLTRLEELSRRVVAGWEEAYEGATQERHGDVELKHTVQTIELPLRVVTDDEYANAKVKVEEYSKDITKKRLLVWHQDAVNRYERQKAGIATPYRMQLHAIRLGDIAITTNDFELYTEFGVQMKSKSRALQTFVIQLAGPGTYVPTPRAQRGGGYSAIIESNVVGAEGGQVLADKTVEAVNALWPAP
ncbi:MAG: hypothetical protein IT367_00115 [Candidatus Hydrogenedentes bacterium]|nr:hypothetical protein [Candidatus Hydrogenedentota bacterium]